MPRLGEHGRFDRRTRLRRQQDLLHHDGGARHGRDHLPRLYAAARDQPADGLDHRPLVLHHVGLDDGGGQRGDVERRQPRPARAMVDLRELDAARPDVENEKSGRAAERIRELCGEDTLNE